jgi:hypothetical protein
MDKQDMEDIAGRIKGLFEEKFGEFREEDFVDVAKELGFVVIYPSRTGPEEDVEYTYHSEQQPGEGYWAAAPGAGDISEGMVWVAKHRKGQSR